MTALHALLAGSIDYAGLFPPAGLGMPATVDNYAHYLRGDRRWALGRFVVPAVRLLEFEVATGALLAHSSGEPWRLSALLGADPAGDIRAIGEFNRRHATDGASTALADVVEAKVATAAEIETLLSAVPTHLQAYVEIPVDGDPAPLVRAIASRGGRAKIRTGGITPGAFPLPGDVARFIHACVASNVPFKATAGLHHPVRGDYPFTYEPDSPHGIMFGFLNVFLAAAFAAEGLDVAMLVRLLEESSAASLEVTPDAIEWRGHRLSVAAIEAARTRTIVSFGSCSFTEPLSDLVALGKL